MSPTENEIIEDGDEVHSAAINRHFHYLENESNHVKRSRIDFDPDDLLYDLSNAYEEKTETDSTNTMFKLETQFKCTVYDTDFPPIQKSIKIDNYFKKEHHIRLLNELSKLSAKDRRVIIHLHLNSCIIETSVCEFILQLKKKCCIAISKVSFDGCIQIPENCLQELVRKSNVDTYLITECFCLKESHYLNFLHEIKQRTKKRSQLPFTANRKIDTVFKYDNIAQMHQLLYMILCDCFIRPIVPSYNKEYVYYHGVGYRSIKDLTLDKQKQAYYKHADGICSVCMKPEEFFKYEKMPEHHFMELQTVTLPTLSCFLLYGDRTDITKSVQVEVKFTDASIVEDVVSFMERKMLSSVVAL